MTTLAPVLQGFFTERLAQRDCSPHTVTAYREAFRMLLLHAQQQLGRPPSALDLTDIDAAFVGGFLDHLEHDRGNTITTRNARLAAIHSLFRYAALRCPEHALLIQRVLAIPHKRRDSTQVCFLTKQETDALLAAPDRTTPLGRRDHLLLLVALQTGLRVSELTAATCADAVLGAGTHLRCTGKGRKRRCTPASRSRRDSLRDAPPGALSRARRSPRSPMLSGVRSGHSTSANIASTSSKLGGARSG